MARFSFGVWDSTTDTYLSGESVQIKDALGGTVLASTSDIGVGLLVSPNGDGTYYCDDIPAQNLWVYIDGAIQQELAGVAWDNGTAGTHIAATSAHGATGDIMGQGDVDEASLTFSTTLQIKALGVLESMINTGAVVAGKLGASAVTTAKINALAVTLAKLGK